LGTFKLSKKIALGSHRPPQEIIMRRTVTALVGAAIIAGSLAASVSDAAAQRRHWHHHHHHHRGGWGWGPGVAAGILGGALITGAILASRPRGYVVYDGYGQPVQYAGCYWAAQPVYDPYGRVVGHTGQPVQVCPGY
jgi:hypothetical protein